MQKILIIGGNGSGKTTFAKKLAQKTRLPLVHLDKLYWKDNWQHVTQEEFDSLLLPELEKDNWIIDGNMKRTLPLRLNSCSLYNPSLTFSNILDIIEHILFSR